jgi:hypothetical protein
MISFPGARFVAALCKVLAGCLVAFAVVVTVVVLGQLHDDEIDGLDALLVIVFASVLPALLAAAGCALDLLLHLAAPRAPAPRTDRSRRSFLEAWRRAGDRTD